MSKTILVVDNVYQKISNLCRETLQPPHYAVRATTTRREALEMLAGQSIDLLIAAPTFDEVEGYDFIEQLRKNYPDLKTILILQEHEETSRMVRRLLETKGVVTNYLSKHVKAEELSDKVKSLIGG